MNLGQQLILKTRQVDGHRIEKKVVTNERTDPRTNPQHDKRADWRAYPLIELLQNCYMQLKTALLNLQTDMKSILVIVIVWSWEHD